MAKHEERGTQVALKMPKQKGLAFQMPEDPPVSDEEIVEREEMIAQVAKWLDPLRELVTRGEGYRRMLRKDIEKCMAARLNGNADTPLLDSLDEEDNGK